MSRPFQHCFTEVAALIATPLFRHPIVFFWGQIFPYKKRQEGASNPATLATDS